MRGESYLPDSDHVSPAQSLQRRLPELGHGRQRVRLPLSPFVPGQADAMNAQRRGVMERRRATGKLCRGHVRTTSWYAAAVHGSLRSRMLCDIACNLLMSWF